MADDSNPASQDEIDALLREAQEAGGVNPSPSAPTSTPSEAAGQPQAATATADSQAAPESTAAQAGGDDYVSQTDIDSLLSKAEQALASIDQQEDALPDGVQEFQLSDFVGAPTSADAASLELMRDVQLDLTIELGRTSMLLENVLQLRQGAVVTLDKLAGDPADIYVNGRLVARGEVLVLNDNFCVRVAELVAGGAAGDNG